MGKQQKNQKLTLWQVIGSVLSAMFGVQSQKNQDRDFKQGNPLAFIMVAIAFVILLIVILICLARIAI